MIQLPIAPDRISKPGVVERLLGIGRKRRAFAMAKNKVLSGRFERHEIDEIAATYKGDFFVDFAPEWRELLEEIMFVVLLDGERDADETKFVAEYVKTFRIPRETTSAIIERAAQRSFISAAIHKLKDNRLDDKEAEVLEALAKRLGLDSTNIEVAYSKAVKVRVQEYLAEIAEDGMVSDQEYEEWKSMLQELRVELDNRDEVEETMKLARERWQVLHGTLEEANFSDVALKKGETAYFRGVVEWYENRKVRNRVDYVGLTGRIQIAKGLSFRYGSIGYRSPSTDQLTLIGTGEVILTNRRALFVSETGDNKSVPWTSVIAIKLASHNEFELERDRGKSPVINVKSASFGNQLLAGFIAQRCLDDCR